MAVISLIGSVQTFFYLLLFQSKRKKSLSDYILMLFLFLLGLVFFDNYLRNTNFYLENPEFRGITYCLPILAGPLMYFYAVLITNSTQKFSRYLWLFILPFLFFLTYFLATYYFLPTGEKIAYYRLATNKPWAMIYASEFFLVFSFPVYALLSLFKLENHARNIGSNFSYTEGISLTWLKTVYILIFVVDILDVITNILSDLIPLFSVQTGDNIAYSINVVLIFVIGYYGFKQTLIYPSNIPDLNLPENQTVSEIQAEENVPPTPKYIKSGLEDSEADHYYASLISIIEKDRLYLDGKLGIKTIADKLGISVNHLSQVINQKSERNFFRFINEYRVEEAKKLLSDQSSQKFTILAIAFDCGFNSKSSFNTIFKAYTGKTPSEFSQSTQI